MKSVIICIGNRFIPEDVAGLQVFDKLQAMQSLPDNVEIVEGGLAGLNLLPFLEQGGRVVFVDTVSGVARVGEVVLLERQEIISTLTETHFDHEAGLAYLLAVLPKVCEGKLPEEIVLIGLEGEGTPQMIQHAADWSVSIAVNGLKGCK